MEANVLSLREFHNFYPKLGFPNSNPNFGIGLSHPLKPSSLTTRCDCLKLCPANLHASMSNSNSGNQQYGAFTIYRDKEGVASVSPVYVPTTPNTDLRTPHNGMTSTIVGERLCGGIIGSLEKSLALFVQSGESMSVWLMKELADGGIGSWSKKFSINVGNCKVWPINFGLEGKLVLMRGFETRLELWDLEKQTFEGFDIDEDDDIDVYTYSDSLVLLN